MGCLYVVGCLGKFNGAIAVDSNVCRGLGEGRINHRGRRLWFVTSLDCFWFWHCCGVALDFCALRLSKELNEEE